MKFIHTGDIHFGCKLKSEYSESITKLLYENQKKVFEEILNFTKSGNCDFLLISGDLFDSENPDLSIYNFVYDKLEAVKIPVYIAPGNHDHYTPPSCYKKYGMPSNVHIFKGEPEIIETENYDIYGCAFTASHTNRSMLENFRVKNPHKKSVMVMHGEIKADSFYNPVSPKQIEESGLSYLALGHIHLPSDGIAGNTCYAFCGTPQPMSFKDGQKGYINIVTFENRLKIEKAETSIHEFTSICTDVTMLKNEETIANMAGNPEKGTLLDLTLTGELSDAVSLEKLKKILTERFLYVNINVACKNSSDISLIKNENSLRGEFVRVALDKLKDYDSDFVKQVINEGLSRL